MTSLSHLLPPADAAPRCAAFARGSGFDPGGSAIRADVVIVVETPLPWPKPVFGHDLLAGVPALTAAANRPLRVLAAVPLSGSPATRVVAFGAEGRFPFRVDGPAELGTLVTALGAGDTAACEPFATPEPNASERAVLICTQGSHDVCCGSEGTRLAVEAETSLVDVEVFRVSHTGGHRFAPTVLTVPDGRMWAYTGLDELRSILNRTARPDVLAPRCRGWWGAARGAAQVAERAVFAEMGWGFDEVDRTVEPLSSPSDPAAPTTFVVRSSMGVWHVAVRVGREVPTISCGAPGGLPAKPGREFEVVSIQRG